MNIFLIYFIKMLNIHFMMPKVKVHSVERENDENYTSSISMHDS